VKGKSSALTANLDMTRDNNGLMLQRIKANLPVSSLGTGMKVRDEHMRKYIFRSGDGKEPDLGFTANTAECRSVSAREFSCPLAGDFSIRGIARPFTMQLRVKESGPSSYRATGDATIKLSDYDIEAPSQLGVKTANEVKVHLEFSAKEMQLTSNRGGEN
jgi:polyisoprenoid-binding protein YceI